MRRAAVLIALFLLVFSASAAAAHTPARKVKPLGPKALTALARKNASQVFTHMAKDDFPWVCKDMSSAWRKRYSAGACQPMSATRLNAFDDTLAQTHLAWASAALRSAAQQSSGGYPTSGLDKIVETAEPELTAIAVSGPGQMLGKSSSVIGIDTGQSGENQVVFYAASRSGTVWKMVSTLKGDGLSDSGVHGKAATVTHQRPRFKLIYLATVPRTKVRTYTAQAAVHYAAGGSETVSLQLVVFHKHLFRIIQLDSQMLQAG